MVDNYFTYFEPINTISISSASDLSNITSDCRVIVCRDLELDKKYTFRNLHNVIIEGGHTITLPSLTTLKFQNCENMLIKDLKLIGVNEPDENGEITIQLVGCKNVHLENLQFFNGEDEQLCIKHGSNNISLDRCTFEFDNGKHHSFAILINLREDRIHEKTNVYFRNCIFNGGSGRYPRCRYASVYLKECTWKKKCSSYLIWPEESDVYVDDCVVGSSAIFCLGSRRSENNVYVRNTPINSHHTFRDFPPDL